MAFDAGKNEQVPVTIRNIELSSTGINFRYDNRGGALSVECGIRIVLKSGETVGESGGVRAVMGDGVTLSCSHRRRLPVNLNDASAVKICEVTIPVLTESIE